MSRELMEQCLLDKCAESFQSLPDFAESVAFLHQFGSLFELSLFSYADLEQALRRQQQRRAVQPQQHDHELFDNLFAEILHYCGFKFDKSTLYQCLHKLIKRVNRWTITPFNAELLYRIEDENDETGEEEEDDGGQENKKFKDHQKKKKKQRSEEEEESGEKIIKTEMDDAESSNSQSNGGQSETSQNLQNGIEPRQQRNSEPDICNLTAEQLLQLITHLFDYLLQCVHEDEPLEQKFSDEQLHLQPLCFDPLTVGRKFWYFPGDTWLFMEEGRPEWMDEERVRPKVEGREAEKGSPNKQRKREKHIKTIYDKKRKSKKKQTKAESKKEKAKERKAKAEEKKISPEEVDAACATLFTASRLRPVCTCSDHFVALIDACKGQRNGTKTYAEMVEKLEQCLDTVGHIEEQRKRKAAERERELWSMSRMSSRIVALMERRRIEEEQRRAKQKALLEEQRRLEEEQAALAREDQDEFQGSTLSREERLRLRQQRIQEHEEREELIRAGLLAPEDEEESEEEGEEGEEEEWWKKRDKVKERRKRGLNNNNNNGGKSNRAGGVKVWRWAKEPPVAPRKSGASISDLNPSQSPCSSSASSTPWPPDEQPHHLAQQHQQPDLRQLFSDCAYSPVNRFSLFGMKLGGDTRNTTNRKNEPSVKRISLIAPSKSGRGRDVAPPPTYLTPFGAPSLLKQRPFSLPTAMLSSTPPTISSAISSIRSALRIENDDMEEG